MTQVKTAGCRRAAEPRGQPQRNEPSDQTVRAVTLMAILPPSLPPKPPTAARLRALATLSAAKEGAPPNAARPCPSSLYSQAAQRRSSPGPAARLRDLPLVAPERGCVPLVTAASTGRRANRTFRSSPGPAAHLRVLLIGSRRSHEGKRSSSPGWSPCLAHIAAPTRTSAHSRAGPRKRSGRRRSIHSWI